MQHTWILKTSCLAFEKIVFLSKVLKLKYETNMKHVCFVVEDLKANECSYVYIEVKANIL